MAVVSESSSRRAEIEQYRAVVGTHMDVAAFDVEVGEACVTHDGEPVEHGTHDARHGGFLDEAVASDPVTQRFAGDELHRPAGGLAGVEEPQDAHHVTMAESGRGPRFVEKAREPPAVGSGGLG